MKIDTDIGRLNQRIMIQYKPVTLGEEIGYQPEGWEDYHACWAAVNAVSGSENWKSGEVIEENTVKFKIRACKKLSALNTVEYRIIFRGRYYDIKAVDDMFFAGSIVNITATAKSLMTFNDGIISICTVINTAAAGDMPAETLSEKYSVRFNYTDIGNSENYTSMQKHVSEKIKIVIPLRRDISVLDVAVIGDKRYSIEEVKHDKETLPPTTILLLSVLEADYDNKTIQRFAADSI